MRIKLEESKRKFFFDEVKLKVGKNWKEIGEMYHIPKSTFEKYRSGKLLLPQKTFLSLSDNLNPSFKRDVT